MPILITLYTQKRFKKGSKCGPRTRNGLQSADCSFRTHQAAVNTHDEIDTNPVVYNSFSTKKVKRSRPIFCCHFSKDEDFEKDPGSNIGLFVSCHFDIVIIKYEKSQKISVLDSMKWQAN